MANLPLAFIEIVLGGVILDAGIKGASIADVVKGQATQNPISGLTGGGGSSTGSGSGSGGGSGSGKVPNTPAGGYNPQTWAKALLLALGKPVTSQAVANVVRWETAEGGNWNNAARYNPLNTTQTMPGSTNPGFSAGVQAYTSWAQGLQATVKTLENGSYSAILAAVEGPASTFNAAVIGSPWGTTSL